MYSRSKSLAMNLQNFFDELKRRHVYRVAIAYGVVAWLLIQVATQVFPFFELSNFVVRVVVAASVLGFPVALIIAWAFEMTPEGLKRADDVAPDDYIPRWSTRKFAALVVSVAILAAGQEQEAGQQKYWREARREHTSGRNGPQAGRSGAHRCRIG